MKHDNPIFLLPNQLNEIIETLFFFAFPFFSLFSTVTGVALKHEKCSLCDLIDHVWRMVMIHVHPTTFTWSLITVRNWWGSLGNNFYFIWLTFSFFSVLINYVSLSLCEMRGIHSQNRHIKRLSAILRHQSAFDSLHNL